MEDEGWEARMAERHRARELIREAEEIARQDAEWDPNDFDDEFGSGCFVRGCSCGCGVDSAHWRGPA